MVAGRDGRPGGGAGRRGERRAGSRAAQRRGRAPGRDRDRGPRRPDRGDPFRRQPGQAPAPGSGRRHARRCWRGMADRPSAATSGAATPAAPRPTYRPARPRAFARRPPRHRRSSVRASASPKSSGGSSRWSMMRTSSSSVYCTSILSPAPVGPLMPQPSRVSRRSDLSGCRLGIAVAWNGTVRGTQGGS